MVPGHGGRERRPGVRLHRSTTLLPSDCTLCNAIRSELERRFLRLCRRHRLPRPEVNARIGAFLVDFLWRDQWLIVETDGYRFHGGRSAFESDRARDVELKLLGYTVVRFTYRQVVSDPSRVARTLRVLMA